MSLKQSIVANFDRYNKGYIIKTTIKRSVNGIVKMSVDLKTDKQIDRQSRVSIFVGRGLNCGREGC